MKTLIAKTLLQFVLLSVLTGIAYPVLVWGIGSIAFPWQTKGCLIENHGHHVASLLIGQSFQQAQYFYGRPSVTSGGPYNAMASGGSNLSQFSSEKKRIISERSVLLCKMDDCTKSPPPDELLQASASGLDPDISVKAAMFQAERVARVRNIPLNEVEDLIRKSAEVPFLDYFGTERVNVVLLNMKLDGISR